MSIELFGPELAPLSKAKPEALIIFLHGLGANGNDLIELAYEMRESLPKVHFLSPDAPFACDMAPFGRQWFSLQNRDEEFILEGIKRAAPLLNNYIDTQLTRFNLPAAKVALVGFSQGTMMSLYTSLRREENLAAIVGFSGALIGSQLLKEELKAKPPIMLIHGDQDEVVPYRAMQLATTTLVEYMIPVEHYTCKGLGHSIDYNGLKLATEFLEKNLK